MLAVAVILAGLAVFGGLLTVGLHDRADGAPPWLRYGHAACGVAALVLVLVLAPGATSQVTGLLVGGFMFTAAAGGILFRQRKREGALQWRWVVAHGILASLSTAALLTVWMLAARG